VQGVQADGCRSRTWDEWERLEEGGRLLRRAAYITHTPVELLVERWQWRWMLNSCSTAFRLAYVASDNSFLLLEEVGRGCGTAATGWLAIPESEGWPRGPGSLWHAHHGITNSWEVPLLVALSKHMLNRVHGKQWPPHELRQSYISLSIDLDASPSRHAACAGYAE